MTQEKRNKIISVSVSVGIHVLMLVVLSLLTLKHVPESEEDGVPVMFGELPDALGNSAGDLLAYDDVETESAADEAVPEEQVPVPQPEMPKESAKEPLMSQDEEPTVSAAEEAERKKKEELEHKRQEEIRKAEEARKAEERRKAEEAERKRQEEERKRREAAERANSKVGDAFSNAKANGNNGKTQGEGLQGSATGNSNDGATTGVGGMGDDPVADVGSRKPAYLPNPVYVDPKGSGTVVVAITVNRSGKVISARIKSTTATEALNNEALKKARISTFNVGTSDLETGTITYKFRLT